MPDEPTSRLEPRHIQAVVGHAEAFGQFLRTWDHGRASGAWLITGPKGIGKATLAHALARFVLSAPLKDTGPGLFGDPLPEDKPADPSVPQPDNTLHHRISAGGHGDLKVIQRGYSDTKMTKRRTVIRVDEVRELGSYLSMTPSEGDWRVVIIDSADELNINAANAVLKGLEEPPDDTLILMTAHNVERVLPTIRSRCRRLSLSPLKDDEVKTLVMAHVPALSDADAGALAAIADGSPGQALALYDAGGLEMLNDIETVLGALPRVDRVQAHALADKLAKSDTAFETGRWVITWWLSRLIRALAAPAAPQAAGSAVAKRLTEAGQGAALDRWLELWEKTAHLMDRARAVNMDKKRVVLDTFAAMERCART